MMTFAFPTPALTGSGSKGVISARLPHPHRLPKRERGRASPRDIEAIGHPQLRLIKVAYRPPFFKTQPPDSLIIFAIVSINPQCFQKHNRLLQKAKLLTLRRF